MPKPPKTVTIRGKRWRFEFTNKGIPQDDVAQIYTKPRKIVVRPRLKGQHRLDIVIHELLHAALWDLDEEAIDSTASDIARVLWRLGYREGTDG